MAMAYLSLFFHALIAFFWWPTTLAGNHSTDHLALLAIKSSITHDPQRVLDTWNTSLHFCQWEGVTCGGRHPYRVTRLDLQSRGLIGSLSPHIGNLTFLRLIRLTNNSFNGVIPPQLGGLFRLKRLVLIKNAFEGEVPASLSNCTRLNILRLGYNQLVGKLPQQLGSLVNLVALTVQLNRLTGGIPSFLGNLTSLQHLVAVDNSLGGNIPDIFSQLHSLKSFAFGMNQLHGMIPPSLYNVTSLTVVNLYMNQLSGGLPKDIGLQLPNLEEFQVWRNKLTGSIPSSISNCSNLVNLDLSENDFTGKVNINFRHIPNLRFIVLFNNSLGSSEPDEMNFIDSMINCSKLEFLLVHKNQLRGVLPTSLGNLSSQLKFLFFSDNLIYGLLPSGVGNLVKLEALFMDSNQLTGIIPRELGNLRNLTRLYLNGNSFTGITPEFLQAMRKLQFLDLSSNEIHGHIPNWVGKIGGNELLYLNLSHNFMTGLPQFHWDRLKVLDLQSNLIQGPFPPSICNARFLRYLDISNNIFGGVIPQCLGNIISSYLHVVDLGNNSFHGPIPNAYKACGGLEGFILNGNHLEGKVPSFLSKCQSLKVLDLGNNHLNDTFPHWSANIPNLQVLVLKSNKFHGPIENLSTIEHPFPSLKLFDLSQNEFVGHLSAKYFQNFDAMKKVVNKSTKPEYLTLGGGILDDVDFGDGKFYSVIVAVKDLQLSFPKFFKDYTIIDLSHNKFEGEIPRVIGSLKYLKVLNLSHNNLNGQIPYALGNLSEIESLDLSWNQLTGEIPQTLVGITNLEVLILSQNHLRGRIPQGKQFCTFEATSFEENPGLCGFPLPKHCEDLSTPPQLEAEVEVEDEESGFTWKVVMLGYGCGTVLGMVLGYIMLSTGKPKWFNAIADEIEHMIQRKQNKTRYVYIGK